ncbi:MAG: tetratricopeptide repeat protein, partial [Acidobacteriota bacterium]
YHAQGNLGMAATYYQKAIDLNPGLTDALLPLGEIQLEQGNVGGATETMRKATEAMPGSAKAHHLLGVCLERSQQFDAALEEFTNAAGLDPNLAEAHHRRGKVLLEQKRDAANALPSLQKAVELDGENPDFLSDYGAALFGSQQFDQAIEVLSKAASTADYSNPAGLYYLGAAYLNKQNYADAVEPLQKAAEVFPTWGAPHIGLVWSYFGQIQKGCPCGPEDEERVAKMQEHYQKAVDLGMSDPALKQRVDALARGEKIK